MWEEQRLDAGFFTVSMHCSSPVETKEQWRSLAHQLKSSNDMPFCLRDRDKQNDKVDHVMFSAEILSFKIELTVQSQLIY